MSELISTKLFFAGRSLIGFLLSLFILKVFRPGTTVRLAFVSVSALVLCSAILMCGDLFSTEPLPSSSRAVPFLKEAGWFFLGVLFGIGRGDFVVAYLDKRDGVKGGDP